MCSIFGRSVWRLGSGLLLSTILVLAPAVSASTLSAKAKDSPANAESIPAGTILPVRLPAISSAKLKKGDLIKGRIAQEVPLPGGAKIRKGTTVLGRVVSTTAPPAGPGAALTIQFDSLLLQGKSIPLRTNLRAMASPLEIEEAQIPTSGPGESDVYDWLTTRQIGDEAVYGLRGPVAAGSQIVGESVGDGVLARARASSDGECRGAIAGNGQPQAFWLFSSNACGLYGFPNLKIQHAGRTPPLGEIVLESTKGPVEIRGGSGALLRVDAGGE
jgi:hypothetical protein